MGRVRKGYVIALLCSLLLCSCSKPGDINPNLPYVSVDAAGTGIATDSNGNAIYGQDSWGESGIPSTGGNISYTYPANAEDMPGVDWDLYAKQSAEQSMWDEIINAPVITTTTTVDEVIIDIPAVTTRPPMEGRPTIDNYDQYTYDEIIVNYGYSDSYCFHNFDYDAYCSFTGQIGQEYAGTYDEACVQFIDNLGRSTVEFTAGDFTHSYWFTKDKVYNVTNCLKSGKASIGQSYYSSDYETQTSYGMKVSDIVSNKENGSGTMPTLYNAFGAPLHIDAFIAVWAGEGNLYVVDRRTTYTIILEDYYDLDT